LKDGEFEGLYERFKGTRKPHFEILELILGVKKALEDDGLVSEPGKVDFLHKVVKSYVDFK
jgi:hypothetical protein